MRVLFLAGKPPFACLTIRSFIRPLLDDTRSIRISFKMKDSTRLGGERAEFRHMTLDDVF